MRVEVDSSGNRIVCGHIYPLSEIRVGSRWVGSTGGKVTVTKVDEKGWIHYDQTNGPPHQKDSFSFQCRYCLILENTND